MKRGQHKLSNAQVLQIFDGKRVPKQLAADYGITIQHVSRIRLGQCYAELTKNGGGMNADRHESQTHKISTPMGSMFVHVDHLNGSVARARVSYPPRYVGTTIGDLLDTINRAIAQEISDIAQRWGK
jgi:hypothetical protein